MFHRRTFRFLCFFVFLLTISSCTDSDLNNSQNPDPDIESPTDDGDGQIPGDQGCNWVDLEGSQLAKLESQAIAKENKLYIFSGFLRNLKITDVTEIYDVDANSWDIGAPMPTAVTHMGAVLANDDIWIVGGFVGDHPGTATDLVQIYNTLTNSWTEGPPLPAARASGTAVFNQNKIHYYGGLLSDRVTDSGDHFVLDLNNINEGWKNAAPLPDPRNHLGGAVIDGKLYAIGGQFGHDNGVDDQDFLDVYDPDTDQWSRLASLPRARSHFEPGTIVHQGKIIIAGGRDGNFFFENVSIYDPQTDRWEEFCSLPEKNLAPAAKIFNDFLIVANGGAEGICCPLQDVRKIPISF